MALSESQTAVPFFAEELSESPPKLTAAEVVDALRKRFTRNGNGGSGEYAFLEQVRNGAAFDASISMDVVVVGLWPSRGLTIEAIEVKVSRGDWRRELAHPEKAEAACSIVDRFWIAAPQGVVPTAEVPPTWGLLEVCDTKRGRIVKTTRPAPLLRDGSTRDLPVTRDLLVGMLRSCPGAIAGGKLDPNVKAIQEARTDERAKISEQYANRVEGLNDQVRTLQQAITDFEVQSGVALTRWTGMDPEPKRIKEVASALKAILNGDAQVEKAKRQVENAAAQLHRLADEMTTTVGAISV